MTNNNKPCVCTFIVKHRVYSIVMSVVPQYVSGKMELLAQQVVDGQPAAYSLQQHARPSQFPVL